MISVIVPIYNTEEYVEKCILSVVNQTYSNFELLLINDGSTDASYEICKNWEQKDKRIRALSKANGGVSSARNLGLDSANGQFIYFLDGDDWIAPTCLEKLRNKMTPDIDVVVSEFEKVDENEVPTEPGIYHKDYEGVLLPLDAIRDCYKVELYARIVCAKLYRKSLWDDIRFNAFAYSEDTFAMFKILEKATCLYYINEPLYYYLQRTTSASHQFKPLHFENLSETLLYMHDKALKDYPMYKGISAERYIAQMYMLLKEYAKLNQKDKALKLIEKMQFVYRSSELKTTVLSNRLLALPKRVVYHLICLKNLLTKNNHFS